MIDLQHYLVLAAVLFCIGLYGTLVSRSVIRVILCVELMLNAVNINFVGFSLHTAEQPLAGLSAVVLFIVVSAAEVGLALALVVALARNGDIGAIQSFRSLREKA